MTMRVDRISCGVARARADEARDVDLMRVESEVAWVALMADVDLPMLGGDEDGEADDE